MSMDLTGIINQNEYYTNHYFSSIFEENASETISKWRAEAKDSEEVRTPWARLRDIGRLYYAAHEKSARARNETQVLPYIREMADGFLDALGYPEAAPLQEWVIPEQLAAYPYLQINKQNGRPLLWAMLSRTVEDNEGILNEYSFDAASVDTDLSISTISGIINEELAERIFFSLDRPPRWLLFIGASQIALLDRNKWNRKSFLCFELNDIFGRREESTLQAMAVLLHRDSLCPEEGTALLDELDANSQKHAAGVSQDLKYALRESIELLGNEVLYDMAHRQGRDLNANPVDAGQLTIECLRYMYRMLFVLFIEARPELGYAPIKAQAYLTGYSLESLRDIADDIRDDVTEVGSGYYLHESLSKLYDLIYNGYPASEEEILKYSKEESLHDMFVIAPLKAHIFDPEYTKMITAAKLRNACLLRIIDLMSLTRETGRRNDRRGRISYANLGINQMGSVYEALLSYRGFIAEHTLFEVKRAGDSFNELDVGYFVTEEELDQYTEDERVRYERDDPDGRYKKGQLRNYEKGTFIYRLAGREREKSASYYTPEVLTKCLVKYALKELLEGKSADEILHLTVCEPAMGSAAFLNEAINQLAEAYIDRKQKELGEMIPAESRLQELQKVKMYIADRNVYGIDLNPVAVELAEVSLWLNTIYEGGFVPWFGTQLVNGNSLIGARRQLYSESALTATSKGLHWYENAPDHVPLGTERKKRRGNAQIYHFLLGDPGMCSYSDKVIKSLEPENIKAMKDWNKKFTAPYSLSDLETLRGLSEVVDELWQNQIKLRQTVDAETQDALSVYGYSDTAVDSHTTIRQKDMIYSKLYKSEHMQNAGPYARLKFAMDYWCALWFWPISKADMLPSRSEFLNDLNLILVGTFSTKGNSNMLEYQQLSMFPTAQDEIVAKINELFPGQNIVDIDNLCTLFPRLALVREIAEQNHFMHWELEFADLFAERGGFDLVIGNPPWIKITWNEQGVLSESHPILAVRSLDASSTVSHRNKALENAKVRDSYLSEYVSMTGEQLFLNAYANYPLLKGQQTNLFRCFLPQAWAYGNEQGVSAFVHPDGVYDDPKGKAMRKVLYPKLRYHFQFENEFNLFEGTNDHGRMRFSLNVYKNGSSAINFVTINNLFLPATIEDSINGTRKGNVPGIKDDNGQWNTTGHQGRVLRIKQKELSLFSQLFDNGTDPQSARLPNIHARAFLDSLECMSSQEDTLGKHADSVFSSLMWDETNANKNGFIKRNIHFSVEDYDCILSGAHLGVLNPFYKCMRRVYKSNNDYDSVDLSLIEPSYLQRCMYTIGCDFTDYLSSIPEAKNGRKYTDYYRLCVRKMLNQNGERTLIGSIIPPKVGHINGLLGFAFEDINMLSLTSALFASLPYDFFIKVMGRSNFYGETANQLPLIQGVYAGLMINRTLLLNCLTQKYQVLWNGVQKTDNDSWAKEDQRLSERLFSQLHIDWTHDSPAYSDYQRRQLLVEIDVLSAMGLGLSLQQLKTIYQLQFPVLNGYEADTWYDANGRIVFTSNRSLTGVGFDRKEWENGIKSAPAGQKFYRTITDDTMPGGPVERTIEYVAPFDRCDREQDYETAWKFFEEKYGGNNDKI